MSKIRTTKAKFGDVVVISQEGPQYGYLGLVIGTLGNGLVVVQWGPNANDWRNIFDCVANLDVIDHIDDGITLGSVVVITSVFDIEDRTGWLGHVEYFRFYESGPRWGVRISMETQGFIAEYPTDGFDSQWSIGRPVLEVIDYIPLEDIEQPSKSDLIGAQPGVQEVKLPKTFPGDITGLPRKERRVVRIRKDMIEIFAEKEELDGNIDGWSAVFQMPLTRGLITNMLLYRDKEIAWTLKRAHPELTSWVLNNEPYEIKLIEGDY